MNRKARGFAAQVSQENIVSNRYQIIAMERTIQNRYAIVLPNGGEEVSDIRGGLVSDILFSLPYRPADLLPDGGMSGTYE